MHVDVSFRFALVFVSNLVFCRCSLYMRMHWSNSSSSVVSESESMRCNFGPNLIIGPGPLVSCYFAFVPSHHFDAHFIFNWLLSFSSPPLAIAVAISATNRFTCVHVQFAFTLWHGAICFIALAYLSSIVTASEREVIIIAYLEIIIAAQ